MSGTSRRSSELIAVPTQPRLAIGFGQLVRTTCKSSDPHDSVHTPILELRCQHREWRIRYHAGRQPACPCATGLLSGRGQAAWRPAFQIREGFSINIVRWGKFWEPRPEWSGRQWLASFDHVSLCQRRLGARTEQFFLADY